MDGFDDHPDLQDQEWVREATRRAEREARVRRIKTARVRLPRRRLLVGTAIAVAAVVLGAAVFATGGVRSPGEPEPWRGVDLDEPFAGTVAEAWRDGEEAVVAPEAQPVGAFSADQVAEAYRRVREAVVAARLDRRVVQDHDVEAFVGLFAPDLQDSLRTLFDGRNDTEAALVATRVAKGTRLLPVPPRATGAMEASVGPDGALHVRTEYTFAYAFEPDDPDRMRGPTDLVAMSRIEYHYVLRDATGSRPGSGGLWTDVGGGVLRSAACDAAKRGFLAPAFTDPSTPLDAGFDLRQPASPADGCPD